MKLKNMLLFFCLPSIFTSSCITCRSSSYYKTDPIYILKTDVLKEIKFTNIKKISNPGKIYLYKNYIFVHEHDLGIHIIDNSNIQKPEKIGFINLLFANDISIKDNILYTELLNELISLDISDIKNIKLLKRIKLNNIDSEERLQIGYKQTGPFYSQDCRLTGISFSRSRPMPQQPQGNTNTGSIGQGGSLARFAIVNDYLYTVSPSELHLYNIANPKDPIDSGKVIIDNNVRDIETIFPYKDKLFMGSQTGTYIYDNKNPQQPTLITKVVHTKSCDPVVVENDTAYVTLKSGSTCRGGNNQLDVIDLKDIKKAKIIKTYPMTNPSGLAIKSNNLFICDGKDGLKIFDAKDPLNIKQKSKININEPMDIILNDNNYGIIVAKDGLHQYDFSGFPNKTDFTEISHIKTEGDNYFDNYDTVKEGDTYYYKWYKEYLNN